MSETPLKKTILVVGDWIVDDYWLTGEHRSITASRVGNLHLRALAEPGKCNPSILAGAGRVALLLHQATQGKNSLLEKYETIGMGVWHKKDTELIKHFFSRSEPPGPSELDGWSPYRLHRPEQESQGVPTLINLADLLDLDEKSHGTTRVVRVLQQQGTNLINLGRVDWEVRPPCIADGDHVWVTEQNVDKLNKMYEDQLVGSKLSKPVAIVIKDMGKGVISFPLVNYLAQRYSDPNVMWFVSTKYYKAPWLKLLATKTICVHLIPEIAAKESVRLGKVYNWFVDSRRCRFPQPTHEALSAITNVYPEKPQVKRIIALPQAYRALAWDSNNRCVIQPNPHVAHYHPHAALASVFFPYTVAAVLTNPNQSTADLITSALSYTEKVNAEEDRWIKNATTVPMCYPRITPNMLATGSSARLFSCIEWCWKTLQQSWDEAERPLGIIETSMGDQNKERLELWRSMTILDGYVCWVPERKKQISRLLEHLRQFVRNRDRKRSMSCIIHAAPGSGKTSLVRGLANAVDMQFLDWNITQMVSRQEIMDCFDTILTTQAQDRHRPVLAFFDEINAECEGRNVYDMFLAPLEDGVYLRNSKKYIIQPCVWLFATTTPIHTLADGSVSAGKMADFRSRITLDDINLTSHGDVGEHMEMLYRGAAMVQSLFPDVKKISKDTLLFFFHLDLRVRARDLRRALEACAFVRFGEFSCRDFPPEVLQRYWKVPERDFDSADQCPKFVNLE